MYFGTTTTTENNGWFDRQQKKTICKYPVYVYRKIDEMFPIQDLVVLISICLICSGGTPVFLCLTTWECSPPESYFSPCLYRGKHFFHPSVATACGLVIPLQTRGPMLIASTCSFFSHEPMGQRTKGTK